VIVLYAFASGLRGLPAVGALGTVAFDDDVVAVVGAVDAPAPRSREAALAHGLVVEALVEAAESVLPVRFGERFADEAELRAAVEPRLRTLRRRLEEVRGCVELGLRVRGVASATSPIDGASYLRDRFAASGAAVREPLRALARECRDGGDGTAYLVPRAQVAAFAGEVDRLALAHPELTVTCTGPWAPYSFAGAAA